MTCHIPCVHHEQTLSLQYLHSFSGIYQRHVSCSDLRYTSPVRTVRLLAPRSCRLLSLGYERVGDALSDCYAMTNPSEFEKKGKVFTASAARTLRKHRRIFLTPIFQPSCVNSGIDTGLCRKNGQAECSMDWSSSDAKKCDLSAAIPGSASGIQ